MTYTIITNVPISKIQNLSGTCTAQMFLAQKNANLLSTGVTAVY